MPEDEKNNLDRLFPEGFIGIRSGIREHIDGERFVGYDLGIYTFLHAFATWRTGICYTNAVAIAGKLHIPVRSVQSSLNRLKELGYVNFRDGDGKRGSYPILIHKYRPTFGALLGHELNAFASDVSKHVIYVHPNGTNVEAAWKLRGGSAEETLMKCGDCALVARIEDSKDGQDGLDRKVSNVLTDSMNPEVEARARSSQSCSHHGQAFLPQCCAECGVAAAAYLGTPESVCAADRPQSSPKTAIELINKRQAFEIEEELN